MKNTIALLDVDNTLIFESNNQLKINDNLITALKNNDITDVYLFTNMSTRDINGRKELIAQLKEKGLTVHGVVTPMDYFFDIKAEELQTFVGEFKEQDLSIRNENDIKHAMANLASQKIKDVVKGNAKPATIGSAFAAIEKDETLKTKAENAFSVSGALKSIILQNKGWPKKLNTKGPMYHCFLQDKPSEVKHIFFFDEAQDCLNAASTIHSSPNENKNGIKLTTVKVEKLDTPTNVYDETIKKSRLPEGAVKSIDDLDKQIDYLRQGGADKPLLKKVSTAKISALNAIRTAILDPDPDDETIDDAIDRALKLSNIDEPQKTNQQVLSKHRAMFVGKFFEMSGKKTAQNSFIEKLRSDYGLHTYDRPLTVQPNI